MADLYLENLTKIFGKTVAVKDVTMKVDSGSLVCLLGPSGCGKTTTLNMVAGILPPTSGEIYIGGVRVTDLPPQERKLGLVFQNYAIFYHMTVYDNVAFGLKIRGTPPEKIKGEVENVAKLMRIGDILNVKGGRLRLDEMQRTALARSIILKPAVFLMDEPLSNLDAALRMVMRVELKRLQREMKQTVLYVTHDQLEAMTIADKIAVMSMGRLDQYDTPDGIYNHPKSKFVAGFIGSPPMNFVDCTYEEGDGKAYLNLGPSRIEVTKFRELIRKQSTSPELILGVRPEDIEVKTERPSKEAIEASVYLVEPLGSEKIANLRVGDIVLKALVPALFKSNVGEKRWIELKKDKIHVMDKKTGAMII